MIKGKLASKANSRKITFKGGRPRSIKSERAFDFIERFNLFAKRGPVFEDDVILAVRVYYESRRTDLDISLLKDLLQNYAYENDRQVKMEFADWAIDRQDPRVEIVVAPRGEWREVVDFLMQFDGYPYEPKRRKRKRKRK